MEQPLPEIIMWLAAASVIGGLFAFLLMLISAGRVILDFVRWVARRIRPAAVTADVAAD